MGKKITRFFIMPKMGKTIADSQVFGWMELLNKKGFPTSIISLVNSIEPEFDTGKYTKLIGGDYYIYKKKRQISGMFYNYRILKKHYTTAKKDADKVIFQTRTSGVAIPLLLLKFFTNAKIIYDARGLSLEEFRHVNKDKKWGINLFVRFNMMKINEWLLVNYSNYVFSVSNLQQKYYINRYKIQNSDRFDVVPCAADVKDFNFDSIERQRKREEYNIKGNVKVILYSGNLDSSWAIADQIFDFFVELLKREDKILLFLLSPNIDIAKEIQNRKGISDEKIIITSDVHKNVRKYLNMADFGLLLREDVLMNNIAFPTKVAEYFLCGLPLISSSNITEVSDVVLSNSFGAVIHNYKVDDELIQALAATYDRNKISDYAKDNLSKECFIDRIIFIFQNV